MENRIRNRVQSDATTNYICNLLPAPAPRAEMTFTQNSTEWAWKWDDGSGIGTVAVAGRKMHLLVVAFIEIQFDVHQAGGNPAAGVTRPTH